MTGNASVAPVVSAQPPVPSPHAAPAAPRRLLFAQHGWADTNRKLQEFGRAVAAPDDVVIAPALGYVRTWLGLAPLVDCVESEAGAALARYPAARLGVVGHSMGGIIWACLLDRHEEWWPRVDALALLASPIGGAELGDAMAWLPLAVARDLSVDRRAIAERVATAVPTLAVAGDFTGGHDGTVGVASTRLAHAHVVTLPGTTHTGMLRNPLVIGLVRAFLRDPIPAATDVAALVALLGGVPGMGPGDRDHCAIAEPVVLFPDGCTVRYWHRPLGGMEVFVADSEGRCLWAGSVGWRHVGKLRATLDTLRPPAQTADRDGLQASPAR